MISSPSIGVTPSGVPIVAFSNGGIFVYKFDQIVSVVSNTVICGGNYVNLSASGGGSYSWTGPNGFISSLQNPVLSNAVLANSGNYHLEVTNGACTSNKLTNVLIKPQPAMNITNNNVSICQGSSLTLTVTGTATTYSWSNGVITSTNNVTPGSTTVFTVTGTGSNSCIVTNTVQVIVNAIPTLTASISNSICIGSSTLLNVLGANTYSWTTGATTSSITVAPTINSTYTVIGTDLNNCTTTQTIAVTVNPTCQDVWPGDANSDGLADNLDVLELGLHYTQSGPTRATTSNAWQSYFSNNWTGTISNGKNVNHSDCNGDGTINNNDTLAIFNNYGLTHVFKGSEQTVSNPQLSIVPDQPFVNKGNWGTASVFLGDASAPVNNINGLAFTLTFDQNLIETNSVYLEYPTSFINGANQNLKFNKLNFTSGLLYTATTHTLGSNVNGNGKIAILHYKIKSTLSADAVLNIALTQAKQSNVSGLLAPLTTGSASVAAIGASVGMNELEEGNYITVYPNPAENQLTISGNVSLQKIELYNIAGQLIFSEKISATKYQMSLDAIASGIYFVKISAMNKVITHEKIVVQR